jgi:hypothetical protein
VTAFRLFEPTADEAAAHLAATPPNAEQLLHPRIRPHCARCGRWVPEASVRRVAHRDSLGPADDDWTGTCSVHGDRVDVVWDEG